jgi:hypothetical protein
MRRSYMLRLVPSDTSHSRNAGGSWGSTRKRIDAYAKTPQAGSPAALGRIDGDAMNFTHVRLRVERGQRIEVI